MIYKRDAVLPLSKLPATQKAQLRSTPLQSSTLFARKSLELQPQVETVLHRSALREWSAARSTPSASRGSRRTDKRPGSVRKPRPQGYSGRATGFIAERPFQVRRGRGSGYRGRPGYNAGASRRGSRGTLPNSNFDWPIADLKPALPAQPV